MEMGILYLNRPYMANAAGRLIGTVLSGLTYQIGGLPLCLGTAGGMVLISYIGLRQIPAQTASPSST